MTERIERQEWKIGSGDDEIRLNMWDFGGQEIMHATHQFFLTKRSLYVLVGLSRKRAAKPSRLLVNALPAEIDQLRRRLLVGHLRNLRQREHLPSRSLPFKLFENFGEVHDHKLNQARTSRTERLGPRWVARGFGS